MGWLLGKSLLPVHTICISVNLCAPFLWCTELCNVKKHSTELPALCNQSQGQTWAEDGKRKKPVPLDWREHHDSISYWQVRTANDSRPCLQLCIPPSAKPPGKPWEPRNWQSLEEWEEECPSSDVLVGVCSMENSEVANIHLHHMGLT